MRGHVNGTEISATGNPYRITARQVGATWVGEAWVGKMRLYHAHSVTRTEALAACDAALRASIRDGLRIVAPVEIDDRILASCACPAPHGGGCKNGGQEVFGGLCYFCRDQPCAWPAGYKEPEPTA